MSTPVLQTSRPSRRAGEFSRGVIKSLYKKSGGRCCKCGDKTSGPDDQDEGLKKGTAAHITAAAPGGPRYDDKMSDEDRSSASNGLWLCSDCHTEIDQDTTKYTVPILKEMKRKGEVVLEGKEEAQGREVDEEKKEEEYCNLL